MLRITELQRGETFTDREATPSWYRETKIRQQSSDKDQKKSAKPRGKKKQNNIQTELNTRENPLSQQSLPFFHIFEFDQKSIN